jgi:hypothetical protein
MIILSPLIGQASGRLGDLVFVRGPRGGYVRSWVQPDETSTTERAALWDAMATVAPMWAGLTDAQRAAWSAFSLSHPRPNRLGQLHPVGGFQEFTRANTLRSQANHLLGSTFTILEDPPAADAACPAVAPAWSIVTATGVLTTTLGPTGGYSSDGQAGFFLWASEPQPATRRAYYGAWTLVAARTAPGATTSFNTTIASGHRPTSGQALFLRARYGDEFGNLREPTLGRIIAP